MRKSESPIFEGDKFRRCKVQQQLERAPPLGLRSIHAAAVHFHPHPPVCLSLSPSLSPSLSLSLCSSAAARLSWIERKDPRVPLLPLCFSLCFVSRSPPSFFSPTLARSPLFFPWFWVSSLLCLPEPLALQSRSLRASASACGGGCHDDVRAQRWKHEHQQHQEKINRKMTRKNTTTTISTKTSRAIP